MTNTTEKTTLKGGSVTRDAKSGQFVNVRSGKSITSGSFVTRSCTKGVSKKRSAALKRLVNR